MNTNKRSKSVIGYSFLSYLIALVGAIILAPIVGKGYESIFNVYCGGGILSFGIDKSCYFEGFILNYSFLAALIIVITLSKIKLKTIILSWLVGTLLFIFLMFLIKDWDYILIIFLAGFIGYLLGKLVLKIKSKISK